MPQSIKQHRTIADQHGAVILDIAQGLVTTLNSTGSYIWQRLQRGEGVETIISSLAKETGVDAEVARCDVEGFLRSLQRHQLINSDE